MNAFRERNESEIRGFDCITHERQLIRYRVARMIFQRTVRLIILHASHSLNVHLIICIPAEAGIKQSDLNPTRLNIFCILGVWQENAT